MAVASILKLRQGATTRRVTLTANGRVFDTWTSMSLERDMAELTGGVTLEFYDVGRARQAFATTAYRPAQFQPLAAGQSCTLALDGEDVLKGWIAQVKLRANGDEIAASVTIMDTAGHLIACAAATPRQPHEYRNLTLLAFAERICAPYGISVRAEVDVGAAFPRLSIEPGEVALAAIEKYARQRSVLVTSDGLGGLVITRGGHSKAPASLRLGEAIVEMDYTDDWQNRFSDYYVRAQGNAQRSGRMNSTAAPFVPPSGPPPTPPVTVPAPATPAQAERAAVVQTGHAKDPEITLYRPVVHVAKSQTQGGSAQEQAEWRLRVARGKGQTHTATVLDWRAGPKRALWRPNQRALVDDLYSDVLEERLIGACVYSYGPEGAQTKLHVVRPGAYDLDPAVRAARRDRRQGRALQGTAHPFVQP